MLESTTYPGTTDEDVLPILEATGLKTPGRLPAGLLARARGPGQPEVPHEDHPEGRRRREPAVHRGGGGALPGRGRHASCRCRRARVAESSKLLENIFRSINIALVNELKMTFDRMGIDIWEVIEAAKTKPFGFTPFYPGPGPRRPLHPARPVLPVVEGGRVRHLDPLHRAGGRNQHPHAALRRREDGRRR